MLRTRHQADFGHSQGYAASCTLHTCPYLDRCNQLQASLIFRISLPATVMRGLQALQPCSTSYLGLQFAQTALAAQSNTQHRSNGHRLQCQVSAMTAQPVVPIQAGPALASSQLLCSRACLHARLARQPRPPAAGLDEVAVGYDRALGNDALRNIFGTAYVVFVVWFAVRVLKRRAGRSMQKVGRPPRSWAPVCRCCSLLTQGWRRGRACRRQTVSRPSLKRLRGGPRSPLLQCLRSCAPCRSCAPIFAQSTTT